MHPYKHIKPYQHWTKALSETINSDVDPVRNFNLKINPQDKIATAGSCFAQHISRYLPNLNLQLYIEEKGSLLLTDDLLTKYNYNVFSARYGNIYTSRQLLQLLLRAKNKFSPTDSAWVTEQNRWYDPYRPSIEPNGFASKEELLRDRQQHLHSVAKMFSSLDVFIFTLGLTETWINKIDGAIYPVCPGVIAGTFNHEAHEFVNLGVKDVIEDMNLFLAELTKINPKAQIILTVSPVALKATALNRHIIESNSVSKSILRAAADQIQQENSNVYYFPSYEIITSQHNRGKYLDSDSRSILESGVSYVMSLFSKHAVDERSYTSLNNFKEDLEKNKMTAFETDMDKIVTAICDEDFL
ncbi:GSCFA domain-containing protein [Kiloniella antarctica]|uniref:GSCFA domain-containing protein n=1 Tax=Kiloniella antarctica TaxID=1550907 RepID=A0ABW5BIN4_9PROT